MPHAEVSLTRSIANTPALSLSVDNRFIRFPVSSNTSIGLQGITASAATGLLIRSLQNTVTHARPTTVAFLNMRNHLEATRCHALVEAFASMDFVFPDGVGLQVARHLLGLDDFPRISGTELVPELLRSSASSGCRIFMLGGTTEVSKLSAENLPCLFPGIVVAGHHHGYFDSKADGLLIDQINASHADVLMIGMGTPAQELWLQRHLHRIRVRIVLCVGGLFHYWSRDLVRAPKTLRQIGLEWLWILTQQPHKWRVYTVGAYRFLAWILRLVPRNMR